MSKRRQHPRRPVEIFFNKYVGGYPHLCRTFDLSPRGIGAVAFGEPEGAMEAFPIELRLPGDPNTLWLWARRVRARGKRQGLELVNLSQADAHQIERFLQSSAA